MKVATWNVNSVRIREPHVCRWLKKAEPDVLLLQEIKCEEPQFPALAFKALGYDSVVAGQKSYNGVAILSRLPLTVHHVTLPGLPADDAQARYLEIEAGGITIGNLYLPNGNSGGEPGYAYKLAWMDCLADRADALAGHRHTRSSSPATTTYAPRRWTTPPAPCSANDALLLVRIETWQRFRRMLWAGLTDAVRDDHAEGTSRGQLLGLSGWRLATGPGAAHRPRPAVACAWPTGWSLRLRPIKRRPRRGAALRPRSGARYV